MTDKIKPLFKYIGGKSWLRDSLRKEVAELLSQKKFKYYAEPFAGGLGSFLSVYDILIKHNIQKVVISDINPTLINTYKLIKEDPQALVESYKSIESAFVNVIPSDWNLTKDKDELKEVLRSGEAYFNQIKKLFNASKGELNTFQSSRLIFLQKHSFNGVYRENLKGMYNTPFNWSGSNMLDTIEQKVLELQSVFLQLNVEFSAISYEMQDYNKDTLYYLDPPYINEDIGENKYNKDVFDISKQLNLIEKISEVSFIYSNHKSDVLENAFKSISNVNIQEMTRKNIMSAKGSSRKEGKLELLITRKNLDCA